MSPALLTECDERPRHDGPSEEWAHLGSNQGPLACEASALPLSYAPSALSVSQNDEGPGHPGPPRSDLGQR